METLDNFFGCRLQFVDMPLLHILKAFGAKEWMRGRATVERLAGYDVSTRGNTNFLIIVKRDGDWKLIHWMMENGVEGWSHETVQEGLRFTHYFYFREAGDQALARLSA